MPNLKFLVVEDDLFYQTYVNDLLAETGVDIINASDGEAGLALATSEIPDLIITDIEIPKIQGFVFFKTLRERPETKNIPVIMMSGKVEKALLDRHSSLSNHAEGYLVKPFSGQVLIDMIRDVIGEEFGFSEVVITPDIEEDTDPPGQTGQETAPETAPEIKQFPEEDTGLQGGEEQLTVLVVDDSRYICDITKDFLEELGVKIFTASDGETGYQMSSDLLPDLVLLDVQMPNLNGFVVCEMLRKKEETKNIPIILMSAVVDDESFQRHSKLRYHADAYLQKPFMKSELHDLVRRFTSLGEDIPSDIESKTGFFVPPEETGEPKAPSSDPKQAAELEQAKTALKETAEREAQLEKDMESIKKEKDQLEAELFELRKTVEGTQSGLQDKLTLVTQRFESARAEAEELTSLNQTLQADLDKMHSSSEETEKAAELKLKIQELQEELSGKVGENLELTKKLQEAEPDKDLKDQVTELSAKLQETNAAALELENRNCLLEKEMSELREKAEQTTVPETQSEDREELLKEIEGLKRDLTAATAAKKEIEDQAKSLLETGDKDVEIARLKQEIEETKVKNQELMSRISEDEDLESELENTRSQLEKALSESAQLKQQLEEAPEDNSEELAALHDQISAALTRAESLEKEKDELSASLREFEGVDPGRKEYEEQIEEIKKELEESRKLAADESQARMDLQGQFSSQTEEKALLESELEAVRLKLVSSDETDDRVQELEKQLAAEKELHVNTVDDRVMELEKQLAAEKELRVSAVDDRVKELEKQLAAEEELRVSAVNEKIRDLEEQLEVEKELRDAAEGTLEALQREADKADQGNKKILRLEKDNKQLQAALIETRKRCEQLEKEVEVKEPGPTDGLYDASIDTIHWDERFVQLESTLEKTVQEAQTILKDQQDRESELEESVDSLLRSLEEERLAYRKEREAWNSKEVELKDAFEDALRESRRLMGEEAARLYPMHIPRRSKPLEVVSRGNKYGIAAAAAIAALFLFAGGYFLNSKDAVSTSGDVSTPVQEPAAVKEFQTTAGTPPQPWIARSGPEETYEELWRRNTVQSVSDDMMIQATLHTREELEAAIKYTAVKEGWTRERIEKAMADMAKTYNLAGSYYITVYSKNLKSGYPGYADSFERHIALRDHSGKEVRARLPGELEGSKFITSRVSAAGKEMNPVFLYEVGLTVAFARKTLVDNPEGLQLVLYDIGAVPMRVLTWDISDLGSLS